MDFKGAIEDSEAVHLYRAVIVQVSLVQDMVQQQKNRGQNPIRKCVYNERVLLVYDERTSMTNALIQPV